MSGNAGSSFPTDSDGARLVNDNFYSQAGSWSVTFSGLTAGFYDVYLYDPSNGTVGTGAGTVTGAGSSSTFGNINGGYPTPDFVSGFNYHLLAGIWVSGEGTLTAFGSSGLYSGLSGIQLVPNQVPERGGTLSMLALGLLFLFGGGRLRP
ncbi:MAG TPA: hypothetical protein VMO26_03470 [Vicinamibacterales bacterium]|nr:hypothetical protein [Vicinamibacterales bacterium]